MYHYVNNIVHPHTIDSKNKSGLADTGASGTYTKSDDNYKNSHKQGHTMFFIRIRQQATIKHILHTDIDPVSS